MPCWVKALFTPEWLTAIGTVGAVIVALILAIWGEEIKATFVRPKLSAKAGVGRPYSEKARQTWLKIANPPNAYYFRIAVQNRGNAAAYEVQVFLEQIDQVTSQGTKTVSDYVPMNLKWAYRNSATLPTLLPHMPPVFCNVVHVTEPRSDALVLNVEFPSSGTHLLETGTYHFHIMVAAANARPRRYKLEIVFYGKWFEEEEKMFDNGFKMRVV